MSINIRSRTPKSAAGGKKTRPLSRSDAKAASREALINAMLDLLPDKGLDVSLDELCARAGYTRGAFYQHFPDREQLLAAVMDRVGAQIAETIIGGVRSVGHGDVAGMARRVVTVLTSGDYPVGKGGLMRSYQLLQACERSAIVQGQYLDHLQKTRVLLIDSLVEAQGRGRLDPDLDAPSLSQLLLALFIGLRTLRDLEAPMDIAAVLPTLLRLLGQNPAGSKGKAAGSRGAAKPG